MAWSVPHLGPHLTPFASHFHLASFTSPHLASPFCPSSATVLQTIPAAFEFWRQDHRMKRHLNVSAFEELAKQGHVQLLFPGDGLKKSVTRFLGGWWIEAAIKGHLT